MLSKKQKEIFLKDQLIEKIKNEETYKKVLKNFPDAEIVDIETDLEKS